MLATRRLAMFVLSIGFLIPAGVLATCGGGGGGGGGAQTTYETTWQQTFSAKELAKKAVYGIVFYIPPGESNDVHSLFKTKLIAEQSRNAPFVKVDTAEERKELRALYDVNEKYPTVVVTDWFGNLISKFETKSVNEIIDGKKIIGLIKNVEPWVQGLQKKAAEKLKSGEKDFNKKAYASAIKDLDFVAKLQGFPEVDQARVLLADIEKFGRERLEEAKTLGATNKEEAIKALKKIAADFKGSSVEREAETLIAEYKKTTSMYKAPPRYDDEYMALCRAHRRESAKFEPTYDEVVLTLEVQALMNAGSELEAAHLYPRARQAYEDAHELDPDDPVPLRYLGEFHRHHSGDWDLARKYFDELLALPQADPYSRAIALHGIGKMTINSGEFEAGLKLLEQSVATYPTQLAYRNLVVYWNSERNSDIAVNYLKKAVALDPDDPYTRVFEAVYIAVGGNIPGALERIADTPVDPSMYYNIACVYAQMRDREMTLELLRKHFYEYETTDAVRSREMLEARSDMLFRWLYEDSGFKELTALAYKR